MAHGGWAQDELATLGPLFAKAARQYSSPWCEYRGPTVHTAATRENEVVPIHMIRSHDGLDSAISSDAPDAWRLPNVPLIDRRLGYPAAYVTKSRCAPEIPEMPANMNEWAGSKSAVSPTAPLEFRLGNAVPVFFREHKGQVARVQSSDEYAACEAARRAKFASEVHAVESKRTKKSTGPTFAWLSHTQRRDFSRVASADAPGWMQTSAHYHRIIRISDSASSRFVPNPKAGASSRPIKTPELAQGVPSASAAIGSHSKHRGRKHVCERAARNSYAADAKQSATAARPPPRKCAELQSAGTTALLRGEPSQHTPAWFVHTSLV